MKLLLLTCLLAYAFSADILDLQTINQCAQDTCAPELTETIVDANLSQSEAQELAKELVSETSKYSDCLEKEFDNSESPCYNFYNNLELEVTPESFANCVNLCGKNYINKYSLQLLKCTCQTCANGADCSSNMLVFAGALLTVLALLF